MLLNKRDLKSNRKKGTSSMQKGYGLTPLALSLFHNNDNDKSDPGKLVSAVTDAGLKKSSTQKSNPQKRAKKSKPVLPKTSKKKRTKEKQEIFFSIFD